MGLLDGKVTIITGAGNGLGAAYAKLFGKEGAKVLVNDLGGARDGSGGSIGAAQAVVDEIRAAGGEAIANGDDVSTMEGGQSIFDQAMAEWGRVDILINNAGILRDETFHKGSEANWDAVIKVHLKGTYCVTKPVWQWMRDNGGGVVVNTTSTSGLIGNFGQTNYGAAKAGIAGFMRCLSIEAKKANITVNVLAPNAYSRMTADIFPDGAEKKYTTDKVSPAIAWLCSDDAADITGRQFVISGNRVSLLYPAQFQIADDDDDENVWSPDEIGQKIRESMKDWPEPANVPGLIF